MRGKRRQITEQDGAGEGPPGRHRRDGDRQPKDADAGRRIVRGTRAAARVVSQVDRPELGESQHAIPQTVSAPRH